MDNALTNENPLEVLARIMQKLEAAREIADVPTKQVWEVDTLVQAGEVSFTVSQDMELAACLNDGWEIVNMTVNTLLEEVDDVLVTFHHRVVTMKRPMKATFPVNGNGKKESAEAAPLQKLKLNLPISDSPAAETKAETGAIVGEIILESALPMALIDFPKGIDKDKISYAEAIRNPLLGMAQRNYVAMREQREAGQRAYQRVKAQNMHTPFLALGAMG